MDADSEQPTPKEGEIGVKPTAEIASRAVTVRDAESAEAEKHQVWTDTMDKIVESGSSQGDYFMEIAGKPTDETTDDRIIVLRTPVTTQELTSQTGAADKSYILFTKDGPFAFTYLPGANGREFEFMKRMKELAKGGINEVGFINDVQNGETMIRTAGYGSHERALDFSLRPVSDPEIVNRAIQESIKEAESPHKARMEAAKTSADLGKSVGSFVSNLPPRE